MTDTFLFERIIRIEHEGYVCRVWISEDTLHRRMSLESLIKSMLSHPAPNFNANILKNIAEQDGVNSVEITKDGYGTCVHKNWP